MKLFIILAAVSLAQAAKLDRVYLPPNAQASAGSENFLQTPIQSFNSGNSQNSNDYSGIPVINENPYAQNGYSDFEGRPERAQAALERNAAILRQDNSNDGETYSYAYETENGIYAEESGVATNGVQAQGGYSYTGDDGQIYSIRYTADENGFLPQGDHLPTSPPIPEEIQKALEQNARDEAAGIYDDGSYNEGEYSAVGNSQQQYSNQYTNAQAINYNDESITTNSAVTNIGARLNGNTVEKVYLPPGNNAQRNGNYNRNFDVTNTAVINSGARFNEKFLEKTYLPPFSQRRNNQRNNNYNGNSAVINNIARFNSKSIDQTYLPPFASNSQRNGNYKGNDFVTKAAVINNSVRFNGNSVEKTYLPPFAQRSNSQRNGSYNARNGYRY